MSRVATAHPPGLARARPPRAAVTAAITRRAVAAAGAATAAANLETRPEPGGGVTAASPTSRRAATRTAGSTAPRARRGRPATRPAGAGGTAEPEAAVPGLMSQLRDIVNDAVREALQTVPPPAGDTAPTRTLPQQVCLC